MFYGVALSEPYMHNNAQKYQEDLDCFKSIIIILIIDII